MPTPFRKSNPHDFFLISLQYDCGTVALYACLRKEYSEVRSGELRGFAINGVTVEASLGHLNGFPEYGADTTVYWANNHYFADLIDAQYETFQGLVRKLGITLSPGAVKEVLFDALEISRDEMDALAAAGLIRRIPLNQPAPESAA